MVRREHCACEEEALDETIVLELPSTSREEHTKKKVSLLTIKDGPIRCAALRRAAPRPG